MDGIPRDGFEMTRMLQAVLKAVSALFALSLFQSPSIAHAQSYPSRPVRMVVPFPPGGGTDVVGRLLAQKLTGALKQQVVVDNRAGAAGRIGAEHVARSAPDGYTLLMATTTVIITAPALFPKLPYDSLRDFAPISPVSTGTYVLVVHPSVPARSVKQLIALAKARPGQLNFASSGPGDTNHLSGELFQIDAGVKLVHVPYKGAAPGTLSVIMGETDLMFSNIVPAIPPIQAGRLRPVGITSLKRSPMLPTVPTVAESGLPGFNVETLYAVLGPAGMPKPIVRQLNEAIAKASRSPETRERLEADGSQVLTSTPDELEKLMIAEIGKWAKVISQAGIKAPY